MNIMGRIVLSAGLAAACLAIAPRVAAEEVPSRRVLLARMRHADRIEARQLRIAVSLDKRGSNTVSAVFLDHAPVWPLPEPLPPVAKQVADANGASGADTADHSGHRIDELRDLARQAMSKVAGSKALWSGLRMFPDAGVGVFDIVLSSPLASVHRGEVRFQNGKVEVFRVMPRTPGVRVLGCRLNGASRKAIVLLSFPSSRAADPRLRVSGHACERLWSLDLPRKRGIHRTVCFAIPDPVAVSSSARLLELRTGESVHAMDPVRFMSVYPVVDELADLDIPLAAATAAARSDDAPNGEHKARQVLHCPMHRFGGDPAIAAAYASDRIGRLAPDESGAMHLCRVRPIQGIARFGTMCDFYALNPFVAMGRSGDASPMSGLLAFSETICSPLSPALVFASYPFAERRTGKRAAVTAALAAACSGFRGILLRSRGAGNADAAGEMQVLLARLEPHLVGALPVDAGASIKGGGAVRAMLCDDGSLLLFAFPESGAGPATVRLRAGSTLAAGGTERLASLEVGHLSATGWARAEPLRSAGGEALATMPGWPFVLRAIGYVPGTGKRGARR